MNDVNPLKLYPSGTLHAEQPLLHRRYQVRRTVRVEFAMVRSAM